MFNNPYIRDIITIGNWDLDSQFAGDGPVFLLGRIVVHQAPYVVLRVGKRPLVIVADQYVGGGLIHARGANGVGVGAPGDDGGTVTVLCRESVNARISAWGGDGTDGAAGSAGSPEVPAASSPETVEWVHAGPVHTLGPDEDDSLHGDWVVTSPASTTEGTPGVSPTAGGNGGNGGKGGNITFTSIVDHQPPTLDAAGGRGGSGGPGVAVGSPDLDAPAGAWGGVGLDGQVTNAKVSASDYAAALRSVLALSHVNNWASFRVLTGKYFYHMHNGGLPDQPPYLQLAANEFARALDLQPDDNVEVEARNLKEQIDGVPHIVEGTDEVIWVGGGNNALGFPRDFDIQPNFDLYFDAFTNDRNVALSFLQMGISTLLAQKTLDGLRSIVKLQKADAEAARRGIAADLGYAVEEKAVASKEADYVQQQLDQTTSEIQAALAEMRESESEFNLGTTFGKVAEIGIAIVGVAAAIPSFGVSIVALVPAVVSLADAVTAGAAPIVDALLAGDDPKDFEEIEKAYKKVEKDGSAVIKAGKSIVNFVTVAKRFSEGTITPDNSKHVALVKRGAELIHRVLIAESRVTLAQHRINVTETKLSGAVSVVAKADELLKEDVFDTALFGRAGMIAIGVAQALADKLLRSAFKAQRSMEIFTLQNAEQYLPLDAGLLSPDYVRDYDEAEEKKVSDFVGKLIESWGKLTGPSQMQDDYLKYVARGFTPDDLRLSFTAGDPELSALQTMRRFSFRVEASGIPADRADAKVRGVRLALVGAANPGGAISCDVRHGVSYEQRRDDGTIDKQLLKSLVRTTSANLTRLLVDDDEDPPLNIPTAIKFWGRGIGGEWEMSISGSENNAGVDLTGLTEIQVWINYQFLPLT